MAEPARKHTEIEPDIRPHFGVIEGGGQSTPDRGSLKALDNLESKPEKPNSGSIADQEANGSNVIKGPWKDNTLESESSPVKAKGRFSGLKKKGPLTAIILTVVGGGLGIGGLLSPGLLLVHLKEVMVEKFNTQLTSMDIRTTKMLKSKALGGVGICGPVINIRCKYSSMSDYQIKKFKDAGIDVVPDADASKNILGRKKIKEFMYNGEPVTAAKFTEKIGSDANFRAAVKKGYNPKWMGFADSIWNKTLFKLKISNKGIKLTGATDDEKLAGIQADTKNPVGIQDKVPDVNEKNADGSSKYKGTDDPNFKNAVSEYDKLKKTASQITDAAATEAGTNTGKGLGETVSGATDTAVKATSKVTMGALSALKVTGTVDTLCTIYGTARAVGFAAKTVRALQLARYAMLFLTIADQIKAGGNPDPADVSYLGSVLTAETKSLAPDGKTTVTKTATDSFGYKYAAYGEVGKMPDSATQFLVGAGFTGMLIGVTSWINNILGKSPDKTCKINNNVFVQIGSAAVGIGAAIFSGGISVTVGGVIQGSFMIALGVAVSYLPELLKDIVAGVVIDKNTVGELAGDAITSGASGTMGTVAATGGNAPQTVEQAVAYQNLSNKVLAQYAEEDRLAYSPFDISNRNTFMGSIYSSLVPQLVKMSSLSGSLSSIASIISMSFASIITTTKAADASQYSVCQDLDYVNMNLAADPYCNLTYGVPPDDLQNISPTEVLDKIGDQIDPVSGEPTAGSAYEKFVNDCMNRTQPMGYTGDDFQGDDGSGCLINDSNPMNKYYYLYQIDQRVETGMDQESSMAGGESMQDTGDSSTSDATADTALDTKTMKELAKVIIDSGNVTDRTGQLKQVAAGNRSDINIKVLKIIANLSKDNKFTISELVRSKNASYGSSTSQHKIGQAVDFSGNAGIDGTRIPDYTTYNSKIQTFINDITKLLGGDCNEVGVPSSYVGKSDKSECKRVFFDQGTGPHIHIGIRA